MAKVKVKSPKKESISKKKKKLDTKKGKKLEQKSEKKSLPTHIKATDWIYGYHAVKELCLNPLRKIRIIAFQGKYSNDISHWNLDENVEKLDLNSKQISDLLPEGAVHQGIAVWASPLPMFDEEDLFKIDSPIMILDQVTDPHNIGAVIRSCAAFGCFNLVLQEKNAPILTGVLAKAASGAVEKVRLTKTTNISRLLEKLKKKRFFVYALVGEAEKSITDMNFDKKTVLILGAEGEGIRQNIRSHADELVKIPMSGDMESLNVSNAAAVSLFAVQTKILQTAAKTNK
jgi:23S rRNA (guanosine2251-2'-O)-methyltransferase